VSFTTQPESDSHQSVIASQVTKRHTRAIRTGQQNARAGKRISAENKRLAIFFQAAMIDTPGYVENPGKPVVIGFRTFRQ